MKRLLYVIIDRPWTGLLAGPVFVAAIFLVAGCGDKPKKPTPPAEVFTNDFGQCSVEVPIDDWDQWLRDHKSVKIVSVAGICRHRFDSNPTSHVLVVYEERR